MKTVTYSKNIFIPVTDICRNRCGYCSFRRDINEARLISRSQALRLMEEGVLAGCSEALFTMGEMPWTVPGFSQILSSQGASDLMDYLVELSEMALETGLLPHTNAGLLDEDDLRRLQPFNASMGLMLETTARVEAHVQSPGKDPELRLQYINLAGRLKLPFTTGILVGIGESRQDRLDSLERIAHLHHELGHIQEVIIQPLDRKAGTPSQGWPVLSLDEISWTVEAARRILPPEVVVQIPPNLADPLALISCGASDLGGISPVTCDGINPDRPWPREEELQETLKDYSLRERLPVYPRFISLGWYGRRTHRLLSSLVDRDGLRAKKYIC